MKVTLISDEARHFFGNQTQDWTEKDYWNIKELLAKNGLTTGRYIWDARGIDLDVPEGGVVINRMGKTTWSAGKYCKLSSAKRKMDGREDAESEWVKEIIKDKKKIISGQYDVIFAVDYVDMEMVKEHRLSYEYARELYSVMLKAEKKAELSTTYSRNKNRMILSAREYVWACVYQSGMPSKDTAKIDVEKKENYAVFLKDFKHYLESIRCDMDPIHLYEVETLDEQEMGDLACFMIYDRATGLSETIVGSDLVYYKKKEYFKKQKEREKMTRREYEKTQDYRKSLQIVKGFVKEVCAGDIDQMEQLCFEDLTKYIGEIADPDMYLITQAIYIILWGDLYDLDFQKMGSWSWNNQGSFRGDTMNSFGSLFGKEDTRKGRSFAFRAKYFGAEKNAMLWSKIETFYKTYHKLGNFIVIPNRGTVYCGINGARAKFYDESYCEGMRDYFDWFLLAVQNYQKKVELGSIDLGKFEMQLQMNPEYNPNFLKIKDWEEKFFLKHYFENGKVKLLFKTPLEKRLQLTSPDEECRGQEGYYGDEEYLDLLEDYIDKSTEVIEYRTREMIRFLKTKL